MAGPIYESYSNSVENSVNGTVLNTDISPILFKQSPEGADASKRIAIQNTLSRQIKNSYNDEMLVQQFASVKVSERSNESLRKSPLKIATHENSIKN